MTMLKTFDLKGNKQSFASWISNLSPCETPFTSMVGKEKVDQTQYSWQTDRLAAAGKDYAGNAIAASQEGSTVVVEARKATTVHTNFTQILRKVVRVSDTTKKISLYGRASELGLQMEKAGMEIKRDLEFMMLNQDVPGVPGTSAQAGRFAGFHPLVAAKDAVDADTGAKVHKIITYAANAVKFTKADVFDITYNLYLAGSKANKIMLHPMHMHVFSDWIADAAGSVAPVKPHVHRMFDGMDSKFNTHVANIRDPLGQDFTLIPNRHMPKNRLFFFNEGDWTQMILREPMTVELAKNGSSEKHMIEMEVGLRHRNPYASGILEFNQTAKQHIQGVVVNPANAKVVGGNVESEVLVDVRGADGVAGSSTAGKVKVDVTTINEDGSATTATVDPSAGIAPTAGVAKVKVKHTKGAKVRATAALETSAGVVEDLAEVAVEFFDSRD